MIEAVEMTLMFALIGGLQLLGTMIARMYRKMRKDGPRA